MLPIVVYLPEINPHSGGMTTMHKLCQLLNDATEDPRRVAYVVPGRTKTRNVTFDDITPEFLDSFKYHRSDIVPHELIRSRNYIALYPEVIPGNPLRAKHVIRWILLIPPSGISKSWKPTDRIIEFLPVFLHLYNKRHPELPDLVPCASLFAPFCNHTYPNHRGVRSGTCFTVRKAFACWHTSRSIQLMHDPVDSIRFEPGYSLEQEKQIDVFHKCERFYSYDCFTFLSVIAAMCGCLSIVAPAMDLTLDEFYKLGGPLVQNGIAYGDSPEQLRHAQTTAPLVHAEVQACIQQVPRDAQRLLAILAKEFPVEVEHQTAPTGAPNAAAPIPLAGGQLACHCRRQPDRQSDEGGPEAEVHRTQHSPVDNRVQAMHWRKQTPPVAVLPASRLRGHMHQRTVHTTRRPVPPHG